MSSPFSNWIKATNFAFTLPAVVNSIDGIEVQVRHKHHARTNMKDITTTAVHLVIANAIQTTWTNLTNYTNWTFGTAQTTVYGGATNTWGATPALTKSTVENSGFGVALYCGYPSPLGDPMTSNTVRIYWVAIKVYYTAPAVAAAANAVAALFSMAGLAFVGLYFQKEIRRIFRRSVTGMAGKIELSIN